MVKRVLWMLALWVGVMGCRQITPPPVPPITPTLLSTPTQLTATPLSTTAPIEAPATVTPIVSATLAATPTAASETTATPEPVTLLTLADFGADRNPLTGELAADPANLQRRPLAVKISNSPASYTRPQAGLSQADLVFEHVTEGPITRFTAIFYSQTPPDVGPIRSARLIDLELPAMYDAALAYSGSSIGVANKLNRSDFTRRILRSNDPGYYRTGADKPWEHTLHGRPAIFWESLSTMDQNHAPEWTTNMAFSTLLPEGGQSATTLTINYDDWELVEWRFDAGTNRYWRWADGMAHTDANTGDQLTAANVVVLYVNHQQDVTICEYQVGDRCQAYSTEIQIWGEGDAHIFRDGQQYEATWRRQNRADMLTFYDGSGNPLPLQLGNTWFQVVPTYYQDAVTVTP